MRRILRAAKLASPQKRRPREYRSRRPPRPRFGMMALTDASRYDWLEGRGPVLTLLGFQDDATGQILAAHFQMEAENTVGYLRALRSMIATHGVPLSLYHDRHGIFQRNDAHWTLAEQLAGKQFNDGSKDGSGAILESYRERDSRVQVYHQENRGLSKALNRGCELARGKYIARMDADDIALESRLKSRSLAVQSRS